MWLPVSRMLVVPLILLSPLCVSAHAADQPPFTITISGPQTVTVGDPVIIYPRVKNISDRKIGFEMGRQYIVLIHDESGKEPSHKPGDWVWAGSAGHSDIEPGKDFPDFPTKFSEYDLVPGKYVVQFARHIDDNDPKSPIIKSNEITFTVVPTVNELSLTLTISGPQTVAVGDKILIKAVLKNISNRTIPIVWGDPFIRLIRDKNGKELPQNPDWDGSTGFVSIEPGKTYEESVPLGLENDLMPGKYVVQLKKQIDPDNPKNSIVESNEITITVVPAPKGET